MCRGDIFLSSEFETKFLNEVPSFLEILELPYNTVVTAPSVNTFRQQLNTINLEKFLIVG